MSDFQKEWKTIQHMIFKMKPKKKVLNYFFFFFKIKFFFLVDLHQIQISGKNPKFSEGQKNKKFSGVTQFSESDSVFSDIPSAAP